LLQGVDIDAGAQAKVDAGDLAQPIEARLRARDIHHRESLLRVGRHQRGDTQTQVAQRDWKSSVSPGATPSARAADGLRKSVSGRR
jgi:hypothetical protein